MLVKKRRLRIDTQLIHKQRLNPEGNMNVNQTDFNLKYVFKSDMKITKRK